MHFPKQMAPTLALFPLSLEEKHVGVYGPLFHILLDTLRLKTVLTHRASHHPDSADTQTHHFRVASVNDDARAVWRGRHLAGGARRGAKAGGGEARPGEGLQGEGVDVVIVDKIPERRMSELKAG